MRAVRAFGWILLPALFASPRALLPATGDELIRRSEGSTVSSVSSGSASGAEIVDVDLELLASAPERLWVELVPGEGRWADRIGIERGPGDDLVWRGRFADGAPATISITLSLHEGTLFGALTPPEGPTYLLRPISAGAWELGVLDLREVTCGVGGESAGQAGDEPPPTLGRGGEATTIPDLGDTTADAGADPEVYLLVLYTPGIAANWSRADVLAPARWNVDMLNTALANSGIHGHVTLAGVVEADVGIMRPMSDLTALRTATKSPLANALRDQFHADVVSVVYAHDETSGGCGIANVMSRALLGPQMASQAFNAISENCYGTGVVLPHEVGHNLGAQHDPAHGASPDNAAYPFSFAHFVDGHFRTLMATNFACSNCAYLEDTFSSPLRSVDGIPTGLENERDNARTLNLTFPLVATFRSGKPPALPFEISPPSELAATVVSPTEVTLTWLDNTDDETGYQVESRVDQAGAKWRRIADLPREATTYTAGGLEPGTGYRFRVRAIGDGAVSAYSNEVSARTPAAGPAVPTGLTAEAVSTTAVALRWSPVAGASGYEIEVRTADPAADRAPIPVGASAQQTTVEGLETSTPYAFRVRALDARGASDWSLPAGATTAGGSGPCLAGAETLCLHGDRFAVRALWRNPSAPFDHGTAAAHPAAASQVTGLLSFFDSANAELAVKLLDGRATNGAFWFFFGSLSNVEYWISVRDTATGRERTYYNPAFELCGQSDTQAFVEAASATAGRAGVGPRATGALLARRLPPEGGSRTAAAGTCVPGPDTLCLLGGRFEVAVDWQNPHEGGGEGSGHVYSGLSSDLSGAFWFFGPDNLELATKILDGRGINGHFWIFWGGLSDVGFTLHVTDTTTGEVHDFVNPPLTQCGGAVTELLE